MEAELVSPGELCVPHSATDEELLRAHTQDYVRRVVNGELTQREIRAIGFPWSPELVHRSRRSSGATIEACIAALDNGFAVNLAGGTHHAFHNRGLGFCVFNDSAIAAKAMLAERRLRRIMIIDCDVHQGNGTATILADEPNAFTFSIHGAKNFPSHKEQSDLDIPLPDATGDATYLEALDDGLHRALNLASPDLAIYLAGADPYVDDIFGRLALTKPGLLARDRLVFDYCQKEGVPVALTMAGGYAKRVEDIVDIHFQTIHEAASRAAAEMGGLTRIEG